MEKIRALDWWVYCIGLFLILGIIELVIAYCYPSLDAKYAWSIFRTHHYFEIPGLFFLGLGMSRRFYLKGTLKEGQIMMWVIYVLTVLIEMILKPFSPIVILMSTSIVGIPIWIGFYGHLIILSLINKTNR